MKKTELFDSHCHIHSEDYPINSEQVLLAANQASVAGLICVGTDADDSSLAVDFASKHDKCWASVGLHPHDSKLANRQLSKIRGLASKPKVVAIGECGLDYHYRHSSKDEQERALREQIELAIEHDLALIFHIREAFNDFWRIFDTYSGIRGVVHSFTGTRSELEEILNRNLYVGLNGIMTFTKDPRQLDMAKMVPIDSLVLETDSPFLTPVPFRGKVNEPRYVELVAQFLAELRSDSLSGLKNLTTQNVKKLFQIN